MREIYDLYKSGEVRFDIIDFDKECEKDLITGKGFVVCEPAFKKDVKNKYGIHSPLFGSDWEDEESIIERYRCGCGDMKGKTYMDETCPLCGEKVKYRDVNYKIFGWIVIQEHYIIHPLWFKIIETAIGAKVLDEIIRFERPTDINGHILTDMQDTNIKPSTPFYNIGLGEFKKRFIEIMVYYKRKKKDKNEIFNFILKNKHKIFTHCIPVCTSVLRPFMIKGDMLMYTELDKGYNPIVSIVNKLNKSGNYLDEMDTPFKLYRVQKKFEMIWDKVFDIINQKDGFIKDQILGGRINYSARNVIIPDPTLKANEVRIGYKCFMELYKQELIAIISKSKSITENEAHTLWHNAMINFSETFYQAMYHIIKNFDPCILLNRNPTINYGSMICVDIVDISRDLECYTMKLSIQTLTEFNADFDGDILNITALKSKDLKKEFRKVFNPRDNMFISRTDGLYNTNYGLLKDQLIGLRDFNTI